MKENLVINSSYAPTEQLTDGQDPHFKISIETTQPNLKIASGQEFLLSSNISHDDLQFQGYGTILELNGPKEIPLSSLQIEENKYRRREGRPAERPKHLYTLYAKTPGILQQRNRLKDLSYSLSAVDHYRNPQTHFRLPVRTLNSFDYETVTQGSIYIARTAFGKFANALPKENQLEFTLLAIQKFGSDNFVGIDSGLAFEMLYEYIDRRILQPGRMLVGTDQRMQRVFAGSNVPIDRIGYREPDSHGQEDLIHVQAQKFRRIFGAGNLEILDQVRKEVARNRFQEERFDWIFRNKKWPLRLDE